MRTPPGRGMAEPPGKRAHRSSAGRRAAPLRLPAAVEEALCGVSSLLRDGAHRLQALKPTCEAVCAVLPAFELLLLQLKEEVGVLVELSQLARSHGDPHAASVVKSHFLSPRVDRLKLLGDLLTNARRAGCTADRAVGLGEYILNELQDELSR